MIASQLIIWLRKHSGGSFFATKHWGPVDRSVTKQHCECLSLDQARQSSVLGKLPFLEREGNNRAENRDPNAYIFILSFLLSGFVTWNKRPTAITVAKLGTGAKRCDSCSANHAARYCFAFSASRSQNYTPAQEQGTAHTRRLAGEATTLTDLPKFPGCPPRPGEMQLCKGCPFLPAAPRGSQSQLGAGNHRSAWARA